MTDDTTEAEQCLTANYEMTDAPLEIDEIDGLAEAIQTVRNDHDALELVRCESRQMDYDVYWNEKTDAVRVGAVALLASYEVPEEFVE